MEPAEEEKPVLQSFKNMNTTSFFTRNVLIIFSIVILLGVGSGYFLSRQTGTSVSLGGQNNSSKMAISKGMIVGSNDLKTFRDETEGVLKEGGKDGEGQFHLERKGGESQYVYLTSSIVDLSLFVNRKVKVNGETQAAQNVGWLMDVGRLEVLE
ncbi:MAG: hypothetical protein HY429_02280 [Candidatus Levybacteria bacterium]|nr:hypothetical protein [Candidatus Levybacteria bacterium]